MGPGAHLSPSPERAPGPLPTPRDPLPSHASSPLPTARRRRPSSPAEGSCRPQPRALPPRQKGLSREEDPLSPSLLSVGTPLPPPNPPPPRFSAASPGTTFQSLLQPLDVHDPPGRLPPSPRCSPPPAPPPLTPRRKPGSSRRAPHTHAHTHTQTPGSATLQHGARAVPVRGPDSPPSPSRRGEGGGGRWRAGRRGRGAGRGDREGNGGTAVRGNGGTIGSEVYSRSLRSLLGLPLSLIPAPPRRSSGKGMGNAELLPEWRRLPAPAPQGDCAPSSPPSG